MTINTKSDLDSLPPDERAAALAQLAATIPIRLPDGTVGENLAVVERMGFVRADFPSTLPELPPLPPEQAPLALAKVAKAKEIYDSGRAATLAIFAQLPAGVQAQFAPVLAASDDAAKAGDIAKAREIVSTCVVPDALAAAQAALVSALDTVLARAAALAAATTVEGVSGV